MYHNTTHTTGAELNRYRETTRTQDMEILAYFRKLRQPLTPRQVFRQFAHRMELTSVRRAITNLTDAGLLEKTDMQVTGERGRPEYLWRCPVEQGRLFA